MLTISQVFDKVAVLYEGRQIFFGAKDEAKQYFIDMGYECPDRQTTADFLTSLTNPAERIVRPGFEGKVPQTPDEFSKAWKTSTVRARLMDEITSFEEQNPEDGAPVEKLLQARKTQKAPLT